MAALSLVSSHPNVNVFPGKNMKGLQIPASAGGARMLLSKRPAIDTVLKTVDATTSLITSPFAPAPTTTTPVPLEPIPEGEITSIKRDYFPSNFKFGASSSAIQCEGNLDVDGRGPSTFDTYVLADQGYNGADSYHLYMEDVKSLKNMGMTAYRFSISWTRILPKGNLEGGINQAGIDYYNKLIDALVDNGISPYVTLCHFEVPTALANSYSSFLNRQIITDFKDYADVCFKNFGNRVKHWQTFNEPFNVGAFLWKTGNNDPQDGAFTATHNLILAHAYAVDHYRTTYKPQYGGEIGIALAFNWIKPASNSPEDEEAAQHARDHEFGWYMNAITFGEYPKTMRDEISELPHFTDEEAKLVKGSFDFLCLNYYVSYYAKPASYWSVEPQQGFIQHKYVAKGDANADGVKFDTLGNPEGLEEMLVYVKETYQNPKIFISENGYAETQEYTSSLQESLTSGNTDYLTKALVDETRLYFIMTHLIAILKAQRAGVNVTGYCVWSLMDSMEPAQGYNVRMGLVFTDYYDYCKRYPKITAKWFTKFNNPHYSSVAYTPRRPQE